MIPFRLTQNGLLARLLSRLTCTLDRIISEIPVLVQRRTSYVHSMQADAMKFCEEILPAVSRTFAINIRVLKGDLYKSVLCAYLFCRIVDTAEDSEQLSFEQRAALLASYESIFAADTFDPATLQQWIESWGSLDSANPEYRLIANLQSVVDLFGHLPQPVRSLVRACVVEMSAGMRATVARKHRVGSELFVLADLPDLERYCHYVAGTVGKMLTDLFILHLPGLPASAGERLRTLGPAFALGLQMTNIIKDCRADYLRGWCYLPADLLKSHGVAAHNLFEPAFRRASQDSLNVLIKRTALCLDDALDYSLAIPASAPRLRLFNLWSLFFAVHTLHHAWDNPALLAGAVKVKISRFEVYKIMLQTIVCVRSDRLLRWLYGRVRGRIPQ